jgi:spore germination protein
MITPLLLALSVRASAAGAWVVPWDRPNMAELASCFKEINPFVYSFDQSGRPKLLDAALLKSALASKGGGAKIVPVIVNDVVDGSNRMQDAKSIALLTKILNTDGLEIDYERIPLPLYPRFERLVEKLAAELHKRGKTLAVDLEPAPIMKRGGPGEASWPRLAKNADALKVMVYYETGSFSDRPGPGASLPWARELAAKAAHAVPADRLVLAYSLAGTDWELPYNRLAPDRKVKRMHYRQTMEQVARSGAEPSYDPSLGAARVDYQDGGKSHELWFENDESLKAKVDLASSLGARAGVWFIGRSHPDLSSSGLCRP